MKLKYNNSGKKFNSATREGAIRNELKGIKASIEEILDGKGYDPNEFDDFANNISDSIIDILDQVRIFNDINYSDAISDETD